VVEALDEAELIVFAPSNPYVSIHPILAVEGIRAAVAERRVPCVAISPLIGGRAVKGPADRMLQRLAGGTTPVQVTDCYKGLIDAIVLDEADSPEGLAVRPVVTRTLMVDEDARRRLAEVVLDQAGAPV
jgi:LPPG:FO 2-phospho-L-lactate transferase